MIFTRRSTLDNITYTVSLDSTVLIMVNITEKIKEYEFRFSGRVQC